MPRVQFTGTGKLLWVPDPTGAGTLVAIAAPSAATLATAVDITRFLKRDGLELPQSGNVMDTSDASSRQNSTDLGTFGGDKGTLNLYRDSIEASDLAWPLFAQGLRGFLLPFWFGLAGDDPAAGDRCGAAQCAIVSRSMDKTAENQANSFSVDLAIVAYNDDATLVA
jgi:hypothetical protein